MADPRLLICLLGMLGIGWQIERRLRSAVPQGWPETLGWSFCLGAILLGGCLYAALAAGATLDRTTIAAATTVAAAVGVLCSRTAGTQPGDLTERTPVWQRWVFAYLTAMLLCVGARSPLRTWDSTAIFGLKARELFADGRLQASDPGDPDLVHYHADYPLLLPLLETELLWAQDSLSDVGLPLLSVGFLLSLTALTVGEARRFESGGAAGALGLLLLSTPLLVQPADGGGLSGYADLPFACLATASLIAWARWLEHCDPKTALTAGLTLGGAVLMKQEGLVWSVAAFAALGVVSVRQRLTWDHRQWGGLAIGTAVVAACAAMRWSASRSLPASPYEEDFLAGLTFDWLRHAWSRPWIIAVYFWNMMWNDRFWGLAWPLTIGGFLLVRCPAWSDRAWLWRTTLLLVGVLYGAIFVLTPNHLSWHLETAMYRLMLQAYPLATLTLFEHLSSAGWLREFQFILFGEVKAPQNTARS